MVSLDFSCQGKKEREKITAKMARFREEFQKFENSMLARMKKFPDEEEEDKK